MYHIKVPRTTAAIQSKPKNQTIKTTITQDIRADKNTLWIPEFRSIFTPWGSVKSQKVNDQTTVQCMAVEAADEKDTPLVKDRLNVVGENHNELGKRRETEKEYVKDYCGLKNY